MRLEFSDRRHADPLFHRRPVLIRVSPDDSPRLRRALQGRASDYVYCESDSELIDACARASMAGGAAAVVWWLRSDLRLAQSIPKVVLNATKRAALLIRCDVTKAAMLTVGDLVRHVDNHSRDLRVSIIGFDDLITDVLALLDGVPTMDACQVVLATLATKVDPAIWDIVAATVILARRRLIVQGLARALASSPRALENRLRRAAAPEAQLIVRWGVVLHTLWRLEVCHLTLGQAAVRADYRGDRPAAALSERVYRALGQRPVALGQSGQFVALLQKFVDLVVPAA